MDSASCMHRPHHRRGKTVLGECCEGLQLSTGDTVRGCSIGRVVVKQLKLMVGSPTWTRTWRSTGRIHFRRQPRLNPNLRFAPAKEQLSSASPCWKSGTDSNATRLLTLLSILTARCIDLDIADDCESSASYHVCVIHT